MKFLSALTAALLTPLLVVYPLQAQLPVPTSPAENGAAQQLQLRVVESSAQPGEPSNAILVEVLDSAGAGVPQAAVVFRFAETDSAPTFADGSHSAVLYTDNSGQANAADLHWGAAHGSVAVRITAAKGTSHAGILYQKEIAAAAVPVAAAPAPAPPPAPVQVMPVRVVPAPVAVAVPPVMERPHVLISSGAPSHRPGTLAESSADSENVPETTADNVPIRHVLTSASSAVADDHPGISIASNGSADSGHSKKKWLIALAVAGAAGAAMAFVSKGKSSSSSGSSSLTIGTPTVSLGHP